MTKHNAFNAIGYGLGAVQMERVRQVDKHDWTPEHDDQYVNHELKLYAEYWLTRPNQSAWRENLKKIIQTSPTAGWEDDWFKYDERTPEERLARAGALICAEIDRLHRAKQVANRAPLSPTSQGVGLFACLPQHTLGPHALPQHRADGVGLVGATQLGA